jgi:hypothetical protein
VKAFADVGVTDVVRDPSVGSLDEIDRLAGPVVLLDEDGGCR